jgi:sarcosine oxidase
MSSGASTILIIGGGIMGAATAMHLSAAGTDARILVVERDPSYRNGATTRSAGGVRQQFSTPECIAMSQATIALLKAEAAPDVAFREQGYLLLASEAGAATLAANAALQRRLGADTVQLTPEAMADKFRWLTTQGVAAGGFGASGEGWIDGAALLQHFKARAQAGGATFLAGEVTGIDRKGDRVVCVRLADGTRHTCAHIVIAAGPHSGAVAHLADVHLPVEPRKRFVFVVDCRGVPEALHMAPLTVDPSGVWFRPEGRRFICGVSPETDADEPDPADIDAIDHDLFQDRIWPTLGTRVPAFEALKVTGAWAGHYDYNTLDQNAVIGPHDEVGNLFFCAGFSGHGLQHAYAAGRAVAETIVHGEFRTLDLTRLGYGRIRRGEPLIELNVI